MYILIFTPKKYTLDGIAIKKKFPSEIDPQQKNTDQIWGYMPLCYQ